MARYTKVQGTQGVYLLPTLTSGNGGDVFKRGGMEYAIASLPEIRQYMKGVALRSYSRAQGLLGTIRAAASSFGEESNNWVKLDLKQGRIDSYLILTDTKNGHKGAMSIEFGRDPYTIQTDDGEEYEVGGMTGKAILHTGFGVPLNSLHGTGGGDIA